MTLFVVVLFDKQGPIKCFGPAVEHSIEAEMRVRNRIDLKPGQKIRVVEIRELIVG